MKPLSKEIVCLDIETTGLDKANDRIIQLAVAKFDRTNGAILESHSWYIKPSGTYCIQPDAAAVHGITDEILNEQGVSLVEIYPQFKTMTEGCDILTYNGMSFDIPILEADFKRDNLDFNFMCRQYVDSYDIEKRLYSHKLVDAYKRYYGVEYDDSHDALADVNATIGVYMKQRTTPEKEVIMTSIETINQNYQMGIGKYIAYEPTTGSMTFRSGKYINKETDEIYQTDLQYLIWMMGKNMISAREYAVIEDHFFHRGMFATHS